jgi:methylated-DNA-protein-cysteine methyltransferase-like protein
MIKRLHQDNYYELVYGLTRMIPKGRVCTYGAISDFLALGSPRMVGWALNQSHAYPDIPAHRVVNRKGELSGRNHWNPPSRMAELLMSEGVEIENDCVKNFSSLFWDPQEISE